jgi:outer membrane lipoprotein SlyB
MNKQFWALALGAAALTGCADNSAMTYNQSQMQRAQSVQLGTVVSVQQVKVKGDSNALLTLGGAALGGLAGSNIGGGSRGSAAGAVVGAMAGGYGAQAAQKNLGGKNALEITVKLDSGQTISIVQGADTPIVNGQRVRVLTGAGADRVVPL